MSEILGQVKQHVKCIDDAAVVSSTLVLTIIMNNICYADTSYHTPVPGNFLHLRRLPLKWIDGECIATVFFF
jgi:hypothetical protein